MDRTDNQQYVAEGILTAAVSVGGDALYEAFKSALDYIIACIALVLLAPVFAVIAVAIRVDSDGPAIFRQRRVGKDGRQFVFLKFRTMRVESDDSIHRAAFKRFFDARSLNEAGVSSFKVADDPRITRVGRLLRSTSLDELPQLVNVLKGEMSLVGPRPPIPYETTMYEKRHWARLAVRPGITGLWQANGRGEVPFEEMVRMDLDYVTRRSLALDVKILILTFGAVLSRRGAG